MRGCHAAIEIGGAVCVDFDTGGCLAESVLGKGHDDQEANLHGVATQRLQDHWIDRRRAGERMPVGVISPFQAAHGHSGRWPKDREVRRAAAKMSSVVAERPSFQRELIAELTCTPIGAQLESADYPSSARLRRFRLRRHR